jgi:hypothetical protein
MSVLQSNRLWQVLLVGSLLALSWFAMMAVHELGHVAGLWATGGKVAKVVLHPLTISRTDPGLDPHPLPVVWAGPLLGVLLPLGVFGVARMLVLPALYLLRFFAGFCLIANGCYIGVGSIDPVGDARELLRLDVPAWHLALFGIATVPLGLYLWHGQGKYFERERVSPTVAVVVFVLLLVTVVAEIAIDAR